MPGWSDAESAIVIYFISRGLSHAVSSDVIKHKCGTTRSRTTCEHKARNIRENMVQNHGLADPYDSTTKSYDLNIVDDWLSRQMDMADLKKLLAIDDKVTEILREHV